MSLLSVLLLLIKILQLNLLLFWKCMFMCSIFLQQRKLPFLILVYCTEYISHKSKYLLGAYTWVNKLRVDYFNFFVVVKFSEFAFTLWIVNIVCFLQWVQECALTVTHSHSYKCRIKEAQTNQARVWGLWLKYACPADYWIGMSWVVKGTAGGSNWEVGIFAGKQSINAVRVESIRIYLKHFVAQSCSNKYVLRLPLAVLVIFGRQYRRN